MPVRFAFFFALAVTLNAQSAHLATSDTSMDVQVEKGGAVSATLWDSEKQLPLRAELPPVFDGAHLVLSRSSFSKQQIALVFETERHDRRLIWQWSARSRNGPIEHRFSIQNITSKTIQISGRPETAFVCRWPFDARTLYVEKGASSPSSEGVHDLPIGEDYQWVGHSSTYAHPSKRQPREVIPYMAIYHDDAEQSGWYAGIEFSGRTQLRLARIKPRIEMTLGLQEGSIQLEAGQTYESPTLFLGAFKGGPDGAGNNLRRWVREVLNNPATIRNPRYPTLVSNSWGTGMAINEKQAHQMIGDAAALGLEMFHVDAGWFRGVGDWESNPEKFPHGVGAVAEYAHQHGLKFGLWTDWTQAGTSKEAGALNVFDAKFRNWLTLDPPPGWKPAEFKGITVDIGVPAAREWVAARVAKIVSEFHLDMLEHDGYLVAQGCDRGDHPHEAIDPATAKYFRDEDFEWVSGSNDTDVSYRATRAYYEVQSGLRRQFPGLLLEICNDGGRMVDFGSAAHGDYFSTSDGYDPLSNRRAFYDASYVMPPAMLESYVEKYQAPAIENFRYMLRSGLMGWFSLMQDSALWTREQRAVATAEFKLYKERLRPLIRKADLYHVSARPDGVGWDGIEYWEPSGKTGVLYAFHGSSTSEQTHRYKLKGLSATVRYRLSYHDGTSPERIASGEELMDSGVLVQSPLPNSSELVFIAALPHAKSGRL